jgi:hypothetical protein
MRNTTSTRAASSLVLIATALAAASGCQRASVPPDQAAWARAALERNATLEVVGSDPATGAFTVRIKSTGEVRTVHIDELVGSLPVGAASQVAPPSSATALAQNTPSAAPAPAPAAAPAPAETPPPSPAPAETTPPAGSDASGGPGPDHQAKPPVPQVAAAPGDRLLRSGPGYSISASGPVTAAAGTAAGTDAAARPALQRRHDPIICQGARPMRIDNQNLAFDGDGLSAEDGCELLITNSHISARGVGVQARNASVHIANSQIEGDPNAVDASGDAQVYARFSTFKGTIHHNDNATFHDLGGNVGD